MKKITLFLAIVVAVLMSNPVAAQTKAAWKEKDAFHEIMSKTFHPAEEGKFEPIRARSAEMVEKAVFWKNSTAPEGYDKKALATNFKELVKGAKMLNKLVQKNATDEEIKAKLTDLHGVFHAITEKCED